jgi:hypothetical protein
MATSISTLVTPLRVLLDDTDATQYQWSDVTLRQALSLIIDMGRIEGYTLDNTGDITPGITAAEEGDPNDYALLLYRTTQTLLHPRSASFSVGTRARRVTRGPLTEWLRGLEAELHRLEDGTYFATWTAFTASTGGAL